MSWTRKIGHPNEVLEKGQKVSCQVLERRPGPQADRARAEATGEDPWETDIPGRYEPGDVVKGKVTKLTNFGVFVELEHGLEGLLHISEWPTTRSTTPRRSSRSATRSRSRSSGSTATTQDRPVRQAGRRSEEQGEARRTVSSENQCARPASEGTQRRAGRLRRSADPSGVFGRPTGIRA